MHASAAGEASRCIVSEFRAIRALRKRKAIRALSIPARLRKVGLTPGRRSAASSGQPPRAARAQGSC
jgi:hypothetical protein